MWLLLVGTVPACAPTPAARISPPDRCTTTFVRVLAAMLDDVYRDGAGPVTADAERLQAASVVMCGRPAPIADLGGAVAPFVRGGARVNASRPPERLALLSLYGLGRFEGVVQRTGDGSADETRPPWLVVYRVVVEEGRNGRIRVVSSEVIAGT